MLEKPCFKNHLLITTLLDFKATTITFHLLSNLKWSKINQLISHYSFTKEVLIRLLFRKMLWTLFKVIEIWLFKFGRLKIRNVLSIHKIDGVHMPNMLLMFNKGKMDRKEFWLINLLFLIILLICKKLKNLMQVVR